MLNMRDYSVYKFSIKEILEGKAANSISIIKLDLISKLNISMDWLNRILNARIGSRVKLDHTQLIIFSDVLDCNIDDLITERCKLNIRKAYSK